MFRQLSPAALAALIIAIPSGPLPAQEIQRGTLKKLDLDNKVIVISANGTDVALTLSEQTQVLGAPGKDLAEKLKDFKEGAGLFFQTGERDGKTMARGLKLAGPGESPRPVDGRRPQSAKVKKVDAEAGTITLTVDKEDLEFVANDRTQFRGVQAETLADKLDAFPAGSDVMFAAQERNGKRILVGMMPARGGDAGQRTGRPVSPEHAGLKPLDELGREKYQGFAGGFYPEGANERPAAHEQAGLAIAEHVRPLNPDGDPDPNGRIVLLSIGMSNTSQASQGFQAALANYDGKNPRLVFINGAQGGMTAAAIQNPDDNGRGTQYWAEVDNRLKQGGVTRQQVQAVWIKQADAGPRNGFPAYAQQLQSELAKIVQVIADRFPNARLCYLSSRTYGGYATTSLNPEPYAYESGFAVKWLIEDQLAGNPSLNYDSARGDVKSPWLSWGPSLWANGTTKRKADGLSYAATDFAADGTHHSPSGSRKVGGVMLEFFRHDSTTQGWFNKL